MTLPGSEILSVASFRKRKGSTRTPRTISAAATRVCNVVMRAAVRSFHPIQASNLRTSPGFVADVDSGPSAAPGKATPHVRMRIALMYFAPTKWRRGDVVYSGVDAWTTIVIVRIWV